MEHIDKLATKLVKYEDYYNKLKDQSSEFRNYRDLWKKASNFEVETKFPIQIELELSNACNYRCGFCPYAFKKEDMPKGFDLPKNEKIMDFDLIKKVIDEGSKNGLMALELGYNTEPLIYKKLFNVISYARQKSILDIRMSSNGRNLNGVVAKKLIEAGLTHLNVSIDAFSKATYKKVRASIYYEEVVQNVLNFIKIRDKLNLRLPSVRVSFVETSENTHEVSDFVKFWEKEVDLIAVQSLVSYSNTPDHLKKKTSKNQDVIYNCHQPWTRVAIKSNGDIKPCCSINGMAFKSINVKDISVEEYWNSIPSKNLRKNLKSNNGHKNLICKNCIENIDEKNN